MIWIARRNRCARIEGMTLIEVMIGVGVLVVATFATMSALGSLRFVQDESSVSFKVHRVARIMEERIRGCPWGQLGQWQSDSIGDGTHNALVWHRRQTPAVSGVASLLPPLSESDTNNMDNNLAYQLATRDERQRVDGGTLPLPSLTTGIPNVKVYVEYYTSDVILQSMTSATPKNTWESLTRGPFSPTTNYALPESPGGPFAGQAMSLGSAGGISVCVRVVVEWTPHGATIPFFHELQIVRRG